MTATIYALSTGSLPSGVATIRVSGPQAVVIATMLAGKLPKPREATLSTIRTRQGEFIDQAILLYFPGPYSFTGEDCLEFQVHGGRALVLKLLEELSAFPDTQHAEAGEFTRRAFENGKIDLVEAEGLADLIHAETEMQRRLAAEQSSGGLSSLYQDWAKRLTHARAMIEAELDFSDEDDVPGSVSNAIWLDMEGLVKEVSIHLDQAKTGEIIRDGLKVVIAGAPNAGKSSLMNALTRRDVAIVTDIPGTTRDLLGVDLDIDGFAIKLYDSAGLRHSNEPVEQEGIRRAKMAVSEADLVLHLIDLSIPVELIEAPLGRHSIRIGNKSDISSNAEHDDLDLVISIKNGNGLEELRQLIVSDLKQSAGLMSLAIPARIRHVNHLRDALSAIENARDDTGLGLDIRAEYLRLAATSLGRITGRVDVETLLGIIFSEFCIGK